MTQPLVLEFTPDKDDYVQASRMLSTKTPVFLITSVLMVLITLGSLAIIIFPDIGDPSWRGIANVFLITSAFYLLYFVILIPFQLRSAFKRNPYLQTKRKFTFTDKNIIMTIADKTNTLEWENIKRLVQSKGSYLIMYQADQRYFPFIPHRAFADQATENEFLDYFNRKSIPTN